MTVLITWVIFEMSIVHNTPYQRGLYGTYCLCPLAKAINPMWPEGVWYNYFKAYHVIL